MSMAFPPFEPDPSDDGRKPRTIRGVSLRALAPNILTLLALCSGLTAIRMSIEARFELAVAAILLAAILDGLDGRVARMLKSTSRFGAELDSLADFLSFGVAPAVLLYAWTLDGLSSVGWIAALVFAICSSLRLARFNVQIDDPKRPSWMSNFFVGIPAPAAALTVLLPVYLQLIGVTWIAQATPLVLVYQLAIAFLMVSTVPTYSGKKLGERIPRDLVLPLFVAVAIIAAVLVSFPWWFMTAMSLAYLASLPFGFLAYRRMERSSREAAEEPGAPGAEEGPGAGAAIRHLDRRTGK